MKDGAAGALSSVRREGEVYPDLVASTCGYRHLLRLRAINGMSRRGKAFFFEKKKQKAFISFASVGVSGRLDRRG